MPKPNTTITPEQLLSVLQQNWATIHQEYDHIAPFTLADTTAFLNGEPGAKIKMRFSNGYTRSRQVHQAISAIGGRVVDRKLANDETVRVYRAMWAIENTATCKYCRKSFKYMFMMGNNNGVCHKSRCTIAHMRDTM
jgi:hypothetical protein